MTRGVMLTFAGLLALQSTAVDFSGEWRLDAAHSSQTGAGAGRGSGSGDGTGGGLSLGPLPDALTIQHDATTLTADERRGPTVTRLVYRLDGTAVENSMPTGRNRGQSATYVSRWEGTQLVTTVTVPAPLDPKTKVSYQEVWSLDADASLVVETRMPGRSGRRAVYHRAPR